MRKKEITKLVLKISDGVFSSLLDLILWNIFYIAEVSLAGSPGNVRKADVLAHKDMERFNSETIKRAIAQAKTRGFIKGDFTLTKEGMERLSVMCPKYWGQRKWDGNWYLAIYDIPKSKNKYRDILRENLKKLGFGQLQASAWVSPFNFLGEVEQIVQDYNLSSCVMLAITDRLGRKEAKVLAEKVWQLDKINKRYKDLLGQRENVKDRALYFTYLDILTKDPQLPAELLPEDWKGGEAYLIFQQIHEKTEKGK